MPFELDEHDLQRLEIVRFRHAQEVLALPPDCAQFLDLECHWHLVCADQGTVDRLMQQLPQVRAVAWLVFGAPQLSLWLGSAVVWEGVARLESKGESEP